jgi:FkbM family methyltransferase
MYIPVSDLKMFWQVAPKSVLHVGAHKAEECEQYEENGWIGEGNRRAIWVEAQKDLAWNLRQALPQERHIVENFAVWHTDDVSITLNIASSSQSSSILDFDEHRLKYPTIEMIGREIVTTKRLDTIIKESGLEPDFLNLDIQGAELIAIQSLGASIANIRWIYTEVNFTQLYAQNALIHEIDEYLQFYGFRRVVTHRVPGAGWGDALYIRRGIRRGGSKGIFKGWQIKFSNLYSEKKIELRNFVKNVLDQ